MLSSLMALWLAPNLRNVGIYGVATGLAAALTLVLTRVLWQTLSPPDFGVWALVDPMLLPAASLLLLGIDHAIVKQLRIDQRSLRQVTGTLLVNTLPVSALGLLVIGLITRKLLHLGWTDALLLTLAGEALILMVQTAFRATGAVNGYAAVLLVRNLLYLAILLIARLYVAPDRLSLDLTFLSRGGCAVLVGLVAVAALRPVLRGSLIAYRDALGYGFPLLLTTFIYALTDMTDRWFLAEFSGVIAVGIYAVHLKLAAVLSQAIVIPFGLWFQPERFKRLDEADGGRDFFIRAAMVLAAICGFLSGAVWLARAALLMLIAPDVAVSPLALACCLGALICLALSQALNVGLLLPGHTAKNAVCMLYAVAATGLVAWVLVPWFGMAGAAISRLLGGVVLLVATAAWSNRIFAVAFPFYTLMLYFAVSAGVLIVIDHLISPGLLGIFIGLIAWTIVSATSSVLLWRTQGSTMRFCRRATVLSL